MGLINNSTGTSKKYQEREAASRTGKTELELRHVLRRYRAMNSFEVDQKSVNHLATAKTEHTERSWDRNLLQTLTRRLFRLFDAMHRCKCNEPNRMWAGLHFTASSQPQEIFSMNYQFKNSRGLSTVLRNSIRQGHRFAIWQCWPSDPRTSEDRIAPKSRLGRKVLEVTEAIPLT